MYMSNNVHLYYNSDNGVVCLSGYTIEGFLSDHPKNSHTRSWTQGAVNCHILGNTGGHL